MPAACFDPDGTQDGRLPPWEIAKAMAFKTVLDTMGNHCGSPAADLIGQRCDEFIAQQLCVKGGGQPSARAVREAIKKCSQPDWYPGQPVNHSPGRPAVYTEHQKQEVARVAMDLKKKLVAPTPRRVRARLPNVAKNPETEKPMSAKTIRQVFATKCYDENGGDPWQWMPSPSQDILPEALKALRVQCARHILRNTTARTWYSYVAIDPCSSMLPKVQARLEEQPSCQ
jgi:hypothetical protein